MPGILRARDRLGSGGAADAGGARRGPPGGERTEDLDERCGDQAPPSTQIRNTLDESLETVLKICAKVLPPDEPEEEEDEAEAVAQAGSMLGSGGVTVMEEGTSMVWAALRLMEFFHHESCGKCSPCREGSSWLVQTLRRIMARRGRMEDLDTLTDLCDNILTVGCGPDPTAADLAPIPARSADAVNRVH